jgi:hypothetical protein
VAARRLALTRLMRTAVAGASWALRSVRGSGHNEVHREPSCARYLRNHPAGLFWKRFGRNDQHIVVGVGRNEDLCFLVLAPLGGRNPNGTVILFRPLAPLGGRNPNSARWKEP